MDEQIAQAIQTAREARMQGLSVNREAAALDILSFQQRRIAILMLQGFEAKEIAAQYRISEKTVRNHFTGIYRKAAVESRIGLILWAVSRGVLTPKAA